MIVITQDDWPNDLNWKDCRKKALVVKAVQMEDDFKVLTTYGEVWGFRGDYLVMGYHGELYPIKREIFEEIYSILAKV